MTTTQVINNGKTLSLYSVICLFTLIAVGCDASNNKLSNRSGLTPIPNGQNQIIPQDQIIPSDRQTVTGVEESRRTSRLTHNLEATDPPVDKSVDHTKRSRETRRPALVPKKPAPNQPREAKYRLEIVNPKIGLRNNSGQSNGTASADNGGSSTATSGGTADTGSGSGDTVDTGTTATSSAQAEVSTGLWRTDAIAKAVRAVPTVGKGITNAGENLNHWYIDVTLKDGSVKRINFTATTNPRVNPSQRRDFTAMGNEAMDFATQLNAAISSAGKGLDLSDPDNAAIIDLD